MDRETVATYERQAEAWVADRRLQDAEHGRWVVAQRRDGPVVDLGCGPGWQLADVDPPTVALDAAAAMLAIVPRYAPRAWRVRASVDALPFASGSVGGAIANRVYLHLPATAVPAALAELHQALRPDAPVFLHLRSDGPAEEFRSTGTFAGRLYSGWDEGRLRVVLEGAGLAVEAMRVGEVEGVAGQIVCRLRRRFTLADTVGAGMRLLVCGLNPSIYAAEAGIGFGRPGNRFWPAALAAGLVRRDRDPRHALSAHGIGMTDLVKRPTARADELTREEYRAGLERVTALAEWLRPGAICFVGLAGWRAAVDRRATAGPEERRLGGRPVYLMPSTSGANAHSRLTDLAAHLRAAAALADGDNGGRGGRSTTPRAGRTAGGGGRARSSRRPARRRGTA